MNDIMRAVFDHTIRSTYSMPKAGKIIRDGQKLAVDLTRMSGDEDVPYGSIHEMLENQLESNADYGILAAAMLEYHSDSSYADDLRVAIENAFEEYVDREWLRICGQNGSESPDDSFMR